MKNEGVVAGLISEGDLCRLREAVCIQVEKIYDSCKEKDCIEDAPVYFKHPERVQMLLRTAINVKCRKAEICDVYTDVEPVPFKKGFYTVDVKFFIKVTLDFFVPNGCGCKKIYPVRGLIVFDKKVILFGSEGSVKIYKTHFVEGERDYQPESKLQQDNQPIAKVEVTEPISLGARIVEAVQECCICCCDDVSPRAAEWLSDQDDDDVEGIEEADEGRGHCRRQVVASVGIFSIIKLARYVQLLIPAFDFCIPNKQCIASTDDEPCDLFDTIDFPVDEFYPPQKFDFPGAMDHERALTE